MREDNSGIKKARDRIEGNEAPEEYLPDLGCKTRCLVSLYSVELASGRTYNSLIKRRLMDIFRKIVENSNGKRHIRMSLMQ